MAGLNGGARSALAGLTGRGLMLQRCSADPLERADVTIDFTVTPEQEELMDLLEGLESEYGDYRAWREAVDLQTKERGLKTITAPSFGEGSPGMGVPIDIPGMSFGDLMEESSREALGKSLATAGVGGDAYEFQAKVGRFVSLFQNYAVNEGYQILEENETLVQGEVDHYSGSPTAGGTAELQKALDAYRPRMEEAAKQAGMGIGGITYEGGLEAFGANRLAEEIRTVLGGRFPVLADPKLDLIAVARATDTTLQELVLDTANDRLGDIRKTRGSLNEKPERVWQFDRAVDRARKDLGVVEGSIFEQIIEDKYKQIAEDEFFKNVLVGALAIGLGAISMGEGAVAVLAAAGGAGLSAGVAAAHIQEFRIQEAAHGTAFDRANAISSQTPSLFWLALDIVFAIGDLALAFKAFRALTPVAEGLQAGEKTVADLKSAAKTFAAGEQQLSKSADAIAEQIEKGAQQHLKREQVIAEAEKLDQVGVAALRAAVKDEAALAGILRIEAGARAKLLLVFKNQPGVLQRLGRIIDAAPQVAGVIEKLIVNMPGQYQAVISKYMLTPSKSAPNIFRALADAGVTADDLKVMANALSKTKSTKQIGKKFATMAIESIADRLPAGAEGIKRLRAVTEGLHPNQSGTIFERWAAKNVYGKAEAERFVSDTKSLAERFKDVQPKPSFHDTKLATDDMRTIGPGKAAIVDYKHYLRAGGFDEQAVHQLDDYAELIRLGVKNDKGEVFTAVEYLFSSKEAALKNEKVIRDILGQRVTIKFVGDDGTAIVLTAGGL